jgi:IclR family acetate operon transcriptional repressor
MRHTPKASQNPPAARRRTAIGKVTAVVEALAGEHTVSGIARATDLPISTVHRILQELDEASWVLKDGENGYVLSARLLTLASYATHAGLVVRVARPVLQRLNEDSGFAVHLGVRNGDEVVYVDKIEGRRSYHMRSRIGLAVPLHSTAIGKALLAHLPEPEVRGILTRTGMPRITLRTITDPDVLLEHLRAVHRLGCATDDEENEDNTRCVAAAVTDNRGNPIAGLSVSGLAFEFDEQRVADLVPLVLRAARIVTAALRGDATPPEDS